MKSQKYWAQFWFRTYEGDISLRVCSLAAQGLWMRMLCYMHEATDYGYLQFGEAELARLTGEPVGSIKSLLKELEDKGVFSRNGAGVIFCRRMVRASETSEARAKAGSAGGRSKAAKNLPKVTQSPPEEGQDAPDLSPQKGSKKVADAMANTMANPLSEDNKIESIIPSPSEMAQERQFPKPKSELWNRGVAIASELTGLSERRAKGLVGKLLAEAADDCAAVLALLDRAASERPMEPSAWLLAGARAANAPQPSPPVGVSPKMRLVAELAGLDGAEKQHHSVPQVIDSHLA